MKTYLKPEINTSLYTSEAIALDDVMILGDFKDASMLAEDASW